MTQWEPIDGALMRLIVDQSTKIREAIAGSVDVDSIVQRFLAMHSPEQTVTPDQARAWANSNIHPKTEALRDALLEAIANGVELGRDAAKHSLAVQLANKAPSVDDWLNVNWDTWKPGNHPAENLVRPKGGLAKLLARTDTTVAGMTKTTLDRIGTRLADGFKNGWTDRQIASTLSGVVSDPSRALAIAHTEMNRAFNVQSIDTYSEWGAEKIEWVTVQPCDECAQNEGEVVNIGDEFPSGDTEPPVHTNCNCRVIASIDFGGDLSGPAPTEDYSGSDEAASSASDLLSEMALIEPEITALFSDIAKENQDNGIDVKMIGLQNRLKGQDSLARKIDDKIKAGASAEEAKSMISDSLRYTMMAPPSAYTQTVEDTLAKLKSIGYQTRVKNTWIAKSPYKGVNVALTSPAGKQIELQFHTPQSIKVKDHANHYLYEKQRVLSPASKEWADLANQMISNASAIAHPKGVDRLGKMIMGVIRKALKWA